MACKMFLAANEATSVIDFAYMYQICYEQKKRKYVKYVSRLW